MRVAAFVVRVIKLASTETLVHRILLADDSVQMVCEASR